MKLHKALYKKFYINELFLSYLIVIFVPIVLPSYQLITGTVINCILAINATNKKPKKIIPLLLIPSLVALLQNLIIGPFSPILIYFIIPIWITNYVYVYVINAKKHQLYILKPLILSFYSLILIQLSVIPIAILIPMGIFQFVTSTIGIVTAKLIKNIHNGNFREA